MKQHVGARYQTLIDAVRWKLRRWLQPKARMREHLQCPVCWQSNNEPEGESNMDFEPRTERWLYEEVRQCNTCGSQWWERYWWQQQDLPEMVRHGWRTHQPTKLPPTGDPKYSRELN